MRSRPAANQPPTSTDSDRTRSFLQKLAYVVAPGSLVVGLLYYFGSTYTAAYYGYFGVPSGDLQISRQNYLVSSPDAIFLPLWVLLWCGLALLLLYRLIGRRLRRPGTRLTPRGVVAVLLAAAAVLLALGFLVYLQPAWWTRDVLDRLPTNWQRDLLIPLAVSAGAMLGLLALRVYRDHLTQQQPHHGDDHRVLLVGSGVVLVGMLTLSLFFATSRYAYEAARSNAAQDAAAHFPGSTKLLIYSRTHVPNDAVGIEQQDLGSSEPFRYRYLGFRQLAKSGSHYYLVSYMSRGPEDLAVVLPDDDSIRVEVLG
ncbi:hypothetical protein E6W39_35100 [Kitasatospora acidiphila]|uniref:Uncharacterized protein n=1 Tax=Kitasatospora acidiphila TaxID=2567942 RepID=A0A540WBQ8_9ACTN|nr:hypothetical protein [Kitasatospora acidiphila]TQF06470.1 hypothetical protein E6W39_35100 [Kitasatospora acidiphila]